MITEKAFWDLLTERQQRERLQWEEAARDQYPPFPGHRTTDAEWAALTPADRLQRLNVVELDKLNRLREMLRDMTGGAPVMEMRTAV